MAWVIAGKALLGSYTVVHLCIRICYTVQNGSRPFFGAHCMALIQKALMEGSQQLEYGFGVCCTVL